MFIVTETQAAPGTAKKQKNLYLSAEARRLLAALSVRKGVGETAVIELLLREEAKREGVK